MSDHPFQHPDPGHEPHEPLGAGSDAEDFLGLGASPEPPQARALEPGYEPAEELRAAAIDTQVDEGWSADEAEPEWDLGADEEDDTMSWLMELEGSEGAEEFDPFTALEEGGGDGTVLAAPTGGGWIVRLAIAGVSLGLGFAGSRFLAGRETAPPTPPPSVAQAPGPQTPTTTTPDSAQTPNETVAQQAPPQEPAPVQPELEPAPVAQAPELVEPAPVETVDPPTPTIEGVGRPPVLVESAPAPVVEAPAALASAEPPRELPEVGRNPRTRFTGPGRYPYLTLPAPFMTLDGQAGAAQGEPSSTSAPGGPTVTVVHGATAPSPSAPSGEEVVTRVVRGPGATELSQDDLGEGMREATAADLSGLWVGGTIPMEKIDGDARLMTPGVGRVRVLLLGGEVFEGELYAVGERKVWIQSETGRLALMSWQIERVEHLVGGTPGTGAADVAQAANVRVRTATGVFYGQLLDRDGRSVTLLTTTGARITLQDAEIDSAGRSATHIVDASGLKSAEDEQP